jgi:hypothetical protein
MAALPVAGTQLQDWLLTVFVQPTNLSALWRKRYHHSR